jgi:DivIVA domain-containing protein
MEDFTAGEVRARTFRSAMRGFDQAEVLAYLEELASYLDAVQQQLHLAGIGGVDAAPLADYGAVGEEVARVLDEARASADTMRARAAAEVADWRSQARADAEHARADAWDTGVAMLTQITAECEALILEAQEISLRLRAEAERDTARMLTDAQREREELARTGREEAERTVSAARKEADSLLMAARHQADVAHERTRALEARRSELMTELESTQKALLGLEEEDRAPVAEPSGREEARSHWPDDDGGVRIVERPQPITPEPVDADALAAEVRALRNRQKPESEPASRPEAAIRRPQPEREVAPPEPEPVTMDASEPESEVEPEAAAAAGVEPGAMDASRPESEAELGAMGASQPESEVEPEVAAAEVEPVAIDEPDPLSGLFDALRAPGVGESPNGHEESAESSVAVIAEVPPHAPVRPAPDSFALRDRLLLPVQNRALRQIKRQLVSAQNHALEELRLDPEWEPEPSIANGGIARALADLIAESTAAGIAAAAELLGDTQMAAVEVEVADVDGSFSHAFLTSISETLERSRSAGAGKRELSSSLSRVFRAWRTDDAERRIRMLSRRAYHRGLLAALDAAGCVEVHIVLLDRSCVDHSDTSAPWPIATGPPAGVLIPPASLECSCTVIPDC